MVAKLERIKSNAHQNKDQHRTPTNNGRYHKTIYQQQQNHRLRTDSILSHRGGDLNAFYWRQIVALDSVVVNTQNLFSSQRGFQTNPDKQNAVKPVLGGHSNEDQK